MYVLLSTINKFVRIEWTSICFVFILIICDKGFCIHLIKKLKKKLFLKLYGICMLIVYLVSFTLMLKCDHTNKESF